MEPLLCLGLCLFSYMVAFSYVIYRCLEKYHVHYTKKLDTILTWVSKKKQKHA